MNRFEAGLLSSPAGGLSDGHTNRPNRTGEPSAQRTHSLCESGNEPQLFSDANKDNDACSAAPTAAELVARHQAGVWRYLRVLGCDNSTADDLTQETFLAVLKRDQLVHLSDAATAAYLRRTAKNLFISLQRRSGRVHAVSDAKILDQVWMRWAGADVDSDELVVVLRQCLKQLTPRAQRSLYLRYYTKKSRTEIGEELGITEHGAKNLMQRAKGQLRQCVEKKME